MQGTTGILQYVGDCVEARSEGVAALGRAPHYSSSTRAAYRWKGQWRRSAERRYKVPWERCPAIPGADGRKIWRRIAIRRYDTVGFVPHADYLIIDSNFCQARVANLKSLLGLRDAC
jgi:hypothetical protein